MTARTMSCAVWVLSMTAFVTPSLFAEDGAEAQRVQRAVGVLESILAAPDKTIPEELLGEAHAVAVIPNMVKGAFLVGGSFGRGLVAARDAEGEWGTPGFVEIAGGSFGLQIGVEATDLVLVFTEPDGLSAMLADKLKLGVDAAAVAGPVGRHVEAGTNVTFDSPIYAYSRNKGVFAGVSLDGSILSVDDSANEKVYREGLTGTDIVLQGEVGANELTQPFVNALERHAAEDATD